MIAAIATIVAIATKRLSDPYDYKFPYDRYDRYRIKKCPRGPGTNSDVLYSGIFFIATIGTISGEWFPYDRNDRYDR